MNENLHDPPRWKDRTDQSNLAERSAGHAFRCATAEPRRAAPPLARVAARIRGARPPRRLAFALAATAFILGVATAASAAHFDLLPAWLLDIMQPRTAPPAPEGARRDKAASSAAPAPPVAAVAPATVAPPIAASTPVPQVALRLPEARTPAVRSVVPPSTGHASPAARKLALVERDEGVPAPQPPSTAELPPAPLPEVTRTTPGAMAAPGLPAVSLGPGQAANAAPAPMPLGRPSVVASAPSTRPASTSPAPALVPGPQDAGKHLTETIHWLRKEHAPASALRLLDRHRVELAQAGFAHEALILRVEALLALGRRAEVLGLLDAASLTDVAASRALLVTRGELRAAANRCAEGIGDFELVLARSKQVDRQALAGRALCRKKLGDLTGARADTQRLREGFPNERLPDELSDHE